MKSEIWGKMVSGEQSILWAIGLVAAALFAWLGKITHMLTNLAERYVPRPEINRRLDRMTEDIQRDTRGIEARADKRFDQITARFDTTDKKLDHLLTIVGGKEDRK